MSEPRTEAGRTLLSTAHLRSHLLWKGTPNHDQLVAKSDADHLAQVLAIEAEALPTVEELTAALIEVEESKLCNACLSDSCEAHDEMPDNSIGCGDAAAILDALGENRHGS